MKVSAAGSFASKLKVLREAGLIQGERRGTWVYYRPQPENLRQLATLLETPALDAVSTAHG